MANTSLLEVPISAVQTLGSIGLWLQTLGVLVILWIVFQSIAFYLNRKRMRELYKIKEDIVRIERKIDLIVKNTKR